MHVIVISRFFVAIQSPIFWWKKWRLLILTKLSYVKDSWCSEHMSFHIFRKSLKSEKLLNWISALLLLLFRPQKGTMTHTNVFIIFLVFRINIFSALLNIRQGAKSWLRICLNPNQEKSFMCWFNGRRILCTY